MSSLGSASDPSVIVAPADSLGAEGGEDRPLREAGKEKRFSLEKRFSKKPSALAPEAKQASKQHRTAARFMIFMMSSRQVSIFDAKILESG